MDDVNKTAKDPRAKWTAFHDKIFADSMVEQIHNGRTTQNGFSKVAWGLILAEFNNKTGCAYALDQVKNRLCLLKRQYRAVKDLIELSGFGWDETLYVVTAEADVWQEHMKEHPNVEQFRTQGFPIYDQMSIICGDSTADGKLAASQEYASLEANAHVGTQQTQLVMQESIIPEPVAEDEQSTGETTNIPHVGNKRRSTTPSSSRSRMRDRGQSCVDEVANAIYNLADASRSRTIAMTDAIKPIEDPYSLNKCITTLKEIEGVTKELFLRGCNALKDPANREIFLAMDANLRLPWLQFLVSGDV